MRENYIIICDESTKKGKNFSYFFGGAMIKEHEYQKFSDLINFQKSKFSLHELKRTKITEHNFKYYIQILELFFMFVKNNKIKVRIMYSPNEELLTHQNYDQNTFMKFYYTFIINAFSIFYANKGINLRLIFDELSETKQKCTIFKKSLINKIKNNNKPLNNKVYISKNQIEEVDSKKHPILQCIDVITGCIDFLLNDNDNTSKRAQAKYKVASFIIGQIEEIKGSFDLLKTTMPIFSHKGWLDKYKHFVYKHKK